MPFLCIGQLISLFCILIVDIIVLDSKAWPTILFCF